MIEGLISYRLYAYSQRGYFLPEIYYVGFNKKISLAYAKVVN